MENKIKLNQNEVLKLEPCFNGLEKTQKLLDSSIE